MPKKILWCLSSLFFLTIVYLALHLYLHSNLKNGSYITNFHSYVRTKSGTIVTSRDFDKDSIDFLGWSCEIRTTIQEQNWSITMSLPQEVKLCREYPYFADGNGPKNVMSERIICEDIGSFFEKLFSIRRWKIGREIRFYQNNSAGVYKMTVGINNTSFDSTFVVR